MGFREGGEAIDSLPDKWEVVPLAKWAGAADLLEQACGDAAAQFAHAGLPAEIGAKIAPDEILVQEYHDTGQLAFIFLKQWLGREYFAVYVWDLPDNAIAELRTNGMWPEARKRPIIEMP